MLTAILTFAQMLTGDLADRPVQQKMATKIVGATLRASGLVRQILSFARKDQGDQREIDVEEIARETLGLLRATTPPSVLTSFTAAAGALVVGRSRADLAGGDESLRQCARRDRRPGRARSKSRWSTRPSTADSRMARFSRRRGPASRPWRVDSHPGLRRHILHVGAMAPDSPCIALSVRDNGGGIRRNVLERMFEPFYTTKGVGQGSGLGLAAVHGIVLSLNGTILVDTSRAAGPRSGSISPWPRACRARVAPGIGPWPRPPPPETPALPAFTHLETGAKFRISAPDLDEATERGGYYGCGASWLSGGGEAVCSTSSPIALQR